LSDRAEKVIWAAGFFDGEGCVSIQRVRNGQGGALQIIVVQKGPRPIEVLADLWGGGINVTHRNQPTGRVGYYRWTLCGDKAADALVEMLPFLVEKRDQAHLAIEFQDHMKLTRQSGKRLTDAVRRYRSETAERLSQMKRRAGATTESLGTLLGDATV
jgi:hypothetical protein